MNSKVEFIEGGMAVDDRGEIVFCNKFDMDSVRRFYQVKNHAPNFVRAWHGHRYESKYIFVSQGSVLIGVVEVNDWQNPDPHADVETFVLGASKPGVLFIPGGYAHGYKTLTDGAKISFFSSVNLEESKLDDYRFDAYFWNPWKVTER